MLLFIEEFQIYGYNFLNWFSDFKIPSVTLSKIKDSIKPDGLEHEGKKSLTCRQIVTLGGMRLLAISFKAANTG